MVFTAKKVTVRTKGELDGALRSAKEIVVEGDDALRAYAEQVIAAPEPAAPPPSPFDPMPPVDLMPPAPAPAMAGPPAAARQHASPRRLWIAAILAAVAVVAAILLVVVPASLRHSFENVQTTQPSPPPPPAEALPEQPQPEAPKHTEKPTAEAPAPPPAPALVDDLAKLGWILVALAAIGAIYRLISKSIDGDRNVEFAWKITQKVSGRLVIKKVETGRAAVRAPRGRLA